MGSCWGGGGGEQKGNLLREATASHNMPHGEKKSTGTVVGSAKYLCPKYFKLCQFL